MSVSGLFVTATDTGVGKTLVAAAIIRALVARGCQVGAIKPVASGCARGGAGLFIEDAEHLRAALGGGPPVSLITPIAYELPLAPPVAARQQGEALEPEILDAAVAGCLRAWVGRKAQVIIAEGVGGFLCPLSQTQTIADLAVALDWPLVIVARRALGTLNHTLLTVEAARQRGLRIAGVILNGADPDADPLAQATNRDELSRWLENTAILAEIPHGISPEPLDSMFAQLHWETRAQTPRYQGPLWRAANALL